MPKFFVKSSQIKDDFIIINNEDVNHISNVLRSKVGDLLKIGNADNGKNYETEITNITKKEVICKILNESESISESKIYINVLQGIPKADKMEYIIQKSTELGVKEITPIDMERCVVKITSKDETKKIERWQKIAEVAAKQSGRDIIPKINNVVKIKDLQTIMKDYDCIIVAYEKEENNTLKQELRKLKNVNDIKIAILIGPEGGISEDEINDIKMQGAKIITLGKRILRTETVAIAMSSIILYELEND